MLLWANGKPLSFQVSNTSSTLVRSSKLFLRRNDSSMLSITAYIFINMEDMSMAKAPMKKDKDGDRDGSKKKKC